MTGMSWCSCFGKSKHSSIAPAARALQLPKVPLALIRMLNPKFFHHQPHPPFRNFPAANPSFLEMDCSLNPCSQEAGHRTIGPKCDATLRTNQ
jgi:hypothetical protein